MAPLAATQRRCGDLLAIVGDDDRNIHTDQLDKLCSELLEAVVECAPRLPLEVAHVLHTIVKSAKSRGIRCFLLFYLFVIRNDFFFKKMEYNLLYMYFKNKHSPNKC